MLVKIWKKLEQRVIILVIRRGFNLGVFVKHEPCPECGSSDGRAMYEDGSYFCWVCSKGTLSEDVKKSLKEKRKGKVKVKYMQDTSEETQVVKNAKPVITEEKAKEIKEQTSIQGKGFRGLKDEYTKQFGVRYSYSEETEEVIEQYYPVTQEGQLTGYKVREVPKNFRSIGRTGADCELFGQFKFNRGGKYVLLVEGECMLPSTKVLTRNGWVALEDYEHGEVMQGDGTFAEPIAVIKKPYNGNLIHYSSGSYEATYTPEHNMIRVFKNEHIKVKASDKTKKHLPVPRTVKFQEMKSNDVMVRLQVMISADFTLRKNKSGEILGAFKKERKAIRCRELLNDAGLKYTETVNSAGYYCFYIPRQEKSANFTKEFSYADIAHAETIIDEVVHWDGNRVNNRNQIEYSSKLYSNAKFIQTCAHLCGYISTIMKRKNKFGEWYKVSILFGKQTSSTQLGYSEIEYLGNVMCLTMPSGSLLISQNDSISITGNCDMLSAYQMLAEYNKNRGSDFETAVVSPTIGANAQKQVAAQYKFFDSFDQIIIAMDSDEAGKKAEEKLVKVLPKGKVKIMNLRYKDSNEYLEAGKGKEFIHDFYNAKSYVPVGVLASTEIYEKMLEQTSQEKIALPPAFHKLNGMLGGGLTLGHCYTCSGVTGGGKTSLTNEMIYHWIFNSPYRVGIVSLELNAAQYGEALMSRHLHNKIARMSSDEKTEYLKSEKVAQAAKELFEKEDGSPRFMLVDDRDSSFEQFQDVVEEMVVCAGVRLVVIDPWTDIGIDGLSIDEQAVAMKWIKSMIKSHQCSFFLINHVRKSQSGQKDQSSGGMITESDIMGSSSVMKSSSANILLVRDKMHEDPVTRNCTKLFLSKNRLLSETGPAGIIYYDSTTHTLHDFDSWMNGNC